MTITTQAPRSGHRCGWLLAAVGAVGLSMLTIVALGVAPVNAFDGGVHDWFVHHREPWLTQAALGVTATGTSTVVVFVVALGTLLLMPGSWRRRIAFTALLVAVFMVAVGLRLWFSDLVVRPRPVVGDWAGYASGYAFPSGHTTASALGAGLLLWVATRTPRPLARVVGGLAVVWATSIGVTRIYLGVHWPTDVVGGWLFALTCVAAFSAMTRGRWVGDDTRQRGLQPPGDRVDSTGLAVGEE